MASMEDKVAIRPLEDIWLIAIGGVTGLVALLWAGGASSALCAGTRSHASPLARLLAFHHLSDPSVAWHAPVGPALVYWPVTLVVVVVAAGIGLLL